MSGRLVHFEVRAADLERAQAFWGDLLGWKFDTSGGEFPYRLIDTGGEPGGGMYASEAADRGILVYFSVDDIDGALVRVRELGGEVMQERTAVPGVGYTARCRDTEGNDFSLFHGDARAS